MTSEDEYSGADEVSDGTVERCHGGDFEEEENIERELAGFTAITRYATCLLSLSTYTTSRSSRRPDLPYRLRARDMNAAYVRAVTWPWTLSGGRPSLTLTLYPVAVASVGWPCPQ